MDHQVLGPHLPNIELANNEPIEFSQFPEPSQPQPIVYDSMQPISGDFEKLSQHVEPPAQHDMMTSINNSAPSPVTISYQPIANSQIVQPQPINSLDSGNFVQTVQAQQVKYIPIQQVVVVGTGSPSPSLVSNPPMIVTTPPQTQPQQHQPQQRQGDDEEGEMGLAVGCCIFGCICIVIGLFLGSILLETGIGALLYLCIPVGLLMMGIGCCFALVGIMTGRKDLI